MSNHQRTQNHHDTQTIPPKNPKFTFTPCTRMSQLAINSQSSRNGRTKHFSLDLSPPSNFQERLMQVVNEENEKNEDSHPRNLDMVLNSDKISMLNKTKDIFSFSDDEEDESDGDIFSSGLYQLSPERPTYNDEPLFEKITTRKSIFDESDDEDEQMDQDVYDASTDWLNNIYHDTNEDTSPTITNQDEESVVDEEDENRPPRNWHNRFDKEKKHKEHKLKNRIPLKEIHIEPELSDNEDGPAAKKKCVISGGKSHKIQIMRALSPPRFPTKRKESITSHSLNTHSLTSKSTLF